MERLRAALKNIREKLTPLEVKEKSLQVCAQLASSSFYQKSSSILFYYPLKNEVSPLPLISSALLENRTVSLPYIEDETLFSARKIGSLQIDSLKKGRFGLEPQADSNVIAKDALDLIIVPGIVFDVKGNRLGFGKGYYDRFLSPSANFKAVKIGLAYEFQVVPKIDAQPHDITMDYIITEKRIIDCKNKD